MHIELYTQNAHREEVPVGKEFGELLRDYFNLNKDIRELKLYAMKTIDIINSNGAWDENMTIFTIIWTYKKTRNSDWDQESAQSSTITFWDLFFYLNKKIKHSSVTQPVKWNHVKRLKIKKKHCY